MPRARSRARRRAPPRTPRRIPARIPSRGPRSRGSASPGRRRASFASDLPEVARPADEPHLPVRDLEAGDVPVRERATAGVEVARRRDRENLVRPAHARARILELGTDGGRGGSSPDALVQRLLELFYRPGRGRVRDAFGEHGTVRVAGDHHEAARPGSAPTRTSRDRASHAGRSRAPASWPCSRPALQRPPDMADEQPRGPTPAVAVGGALVAVHEEQRAGRLAGTRPRSAAAPRAP